MNSRFPIIVACIAVGVGSTVFVATFLHILITIPSDSEQRVASTTPVVTAPAAQPARLVIPSIQVDAAVEAVGLTKGGAMATAKKAGDVGWYKFGTAPGQKGSAVIDGHVDNTFAFPGVFRELKKLKKGDDVYIDTESGERLHFVVEEVRTYPYKGVPAEELFTRDDAARLNLITCGGTWIQSEKTYDHRIIAYTRLVTN